MRTALGPAALGAATLLAGLVLQARSVGQDGRAGQAAPAAGGTYTGAANCLRCHSRPRPDDVGRGSTGFVLLSEYSIWKTHDKHAQAYAVLLGHRSQAIARLLKQDVKDPRTGCMNCHAMQYAVGHNDSDFRLEDGVSCSGCHGPSVASAGGWIDDHARPAWRLLSAAEKKKRGMENLRDPEVRARLCTSCHVGNAEEGKVVTHEMFAAGHPPLPPFDVAFFSDKEPQHWRNARDVPFFQGGDDPVWKGLSDAQRERVRKNYELDKAAFARTRLALVGGVVALGETMRLVRQRSDASMAGREAGQVWPELLAPAEDGPPPAPSAARVRALWAELALAHSDCYACHHDLRVPGYRQQRGYGYRLYEGGTVPVTAGRVPVRLWPFALLDLAIRHAGRGQADPAGYRDAMRKGLYQAVHALATAGTTQPLGNPAELHTKAAELEDWCRQLAADLRQARYDADGALAVLEDAANLQTAENADYETARQIASVCRVVFEEWDAATGGKDGRAAALRKSIDALSQRTHLDFYTGRQKRLDLVTQLVVRLAGETAPAEKQRIEAARREFTDYIGDIGNPSKLRGLTRNPFVKALEDVGNDQLTKNLMDGPTLDRLTAISDEELAATLAVIAHYEPKPFYQELRNLAAALRPVAGTTGR
jgi:hypothetical protein